MRVYKWCRESNVLLAVLALSLVLQIALGREKPIPEFDECTFYRVADNISKTGLPFIDLESDILYFIQPPLSYYLISIPLILSFRSLFAARFVSTIISLGIILLTFGIGKRIEKMTGLEHIGLIASFLLAWNPLFLVYSHSIYMEPTLTLFLVASVMLFILGEEYEKHFYYLLSGFALGLAFLTKYFFPVLITISYVIFLLYRHRINLLKQLKVYYLLIPAVAVFSLWFLFGYMTDLKGLLYEFQSWLYYSKNTALHDNRAHISGLSYSLKVAKAVAPSVTFLFVLSFVHELTLIAKRRLCENISLLIVILITIWTFPLFLILLRDPKYFLPILPLIMIISAKKIAVLKSLYLSRGRVVRIAIVAALGLFILFAFPIDPLGLDRIPVLEKLYSSRYLWSIRNNRAMGSLQEAGLFVSQVTKPDEIVATCRSPQIGFYAKRRCLFLHTHSFSEALNVLQESRVVVRDGDEWFLPYLNQWEREEFLSIIYEKLRLVKTIGKIEIYSK